MTEETFSRHVGPSSELLFSVPVKRGFVPWRGTMSYASRLRLFLRLADALPVVGHEGPERGLYVGSIDRLRTLHFARWTLFDEDRRLLLAVTFDHPLEPYLRRIVDEAGPLLDAILCHCEDYDGCSTDLGYAGFLGYAQRHQIDVDSFTAARPETTVDDAGILGALERMQREMTDPAAFDLAAAKHRLETPGMAAARIWKDPLERLKTQRQALRILRAMHYNSRFFPAPASGAPGLDGGYKDHLFFRRYAMSLMEGFDPTGLPAADWAAFRGPLEWAGLLSPTGQPVAAPKRTASRPPEVPYPRDNVQAGLVTPHLVDGARPNLAALVSLRFESRAAAAAFLRRVEARIGSEAAGGPWPRINFALTSRGLSTLGAPEAERLRFPAAFREGMAARAGVLGDIGRNHPSNWRPIQQGPDATPNATLHLGAVDAYLLLHTRVDDPHRFARYSRRHPLLRELRALKAGIPGVLAVGFEPLHSMQGPDGQARGHFGYVDGISQPTIDQPGRDFAPAGALLLGRGSDGGEATPELQVDGSFLVIRKYEQHVAAFRRLTDGRGGAALSAKIMGRTLDGDPLVAPGATNDFDYYGDPDGERCPFGSHIRRANPRQREGYDPTDKEFRSAPTPRIMRRGYSYGPRGGQAERGLMFMCYNANLAEQFELIQRWIAGGNVTGIASADNDPLLAPPPPSGARTFRYLDQDRRGQIVVRRKVIDEALTTLRWGAYAFAPSIRALGMLADLADKGAKEADAAAEAREGARIVEALVARWRAGEDVTAEWKSLLEEADPKVRDRGRAVCAFARRAHQGVMDAGPFVLVVDPEETRRVLHDSRAYSVRDYWRHMRSTTGAVFLGIDPDPQPLSLLTQDSSDAAFERETAGEYNRIAPATNPFLGALSHDNPGAERLRRAAFEKTFLGVTQDLLPQVPEEPDPTTGKRRRLIDFEALIAAAIVRFGLVWYGLPETLVDIAPRPTDDGVTPPPTPFDLVELATWLFGAWPSPDTEARAVRAAKRLFGAVEAYLGGLPPGAMAPPQTLLGHLQRAPSIRKDDIPRVLVASMTGLTTPTTLSFAGVAYEWMREKSFWRRRDAFLKANDRGLAPYDAALATLRTPLLETMARRGSPRFAPRRVAAEGVEIGGLRVAPGRQVAAALPAAAEVKTDLRRVEELLFGGLYGEAGAPVHACPGRGAALTVMLATMAGVMASGELVENSSLTAYLRPPA